MEGSCLCVFSCSMSSATLCKYVCLVVHLNVGKKNMFLMAGVHVDAHMTSIL